jgi:hypothetical protein
LILAFMPPKPGSTGAEFRRAKLVQTPRKGTAGSFEERFPLLERCLAGQPELARNEQRARFGPLPSNFEFLLTVAPDAVDRILADAELRKFLVWVNPGPNGTQLFGAGLVVSDRTEETTAWLRQGRAAGTKIDVAARDVEGRLRLFEYYCA